MPLCLLLQQSEPLRLFYRISEKHTRRKHSGKLAAKVLHVQTQRNEQPSSAAPANVQKCTSSTQSLSKVRIVRDNNGCKVALTSDKVTSAGDSSARKRPPSPAVGSNSASGSSAKKAKFSVSNLLRDVNEPKESAPTAAAAAKSTAAAALVAQNSSTSSSSSKEKDYVEQKIRERELFRQRQLEREAKERAAAKKAKSTNRNLDDLERAIQLLHEDEGERRHHHRPHHSSHKKDRRDRERDRERDRQLAAERARQKSRELKERKSLTTTGKPAPLAVDPAIANAPFSSQLTSKGTLVLHRSPTTPPSGGLFSPPAASPPSASRDPSPRPKDKPAEKPLVSSPTKVSVPPPAPPARPAPAQPITLKIPRPEPQKTAQPSPPAPLNGLVRTPTTSTSFPSPPPRPLFAHVPQRAPPSTRPASPAPTPSHFAYKISLAPTRHTAGVAPRPHTTSVTGLSATKRHHTHPPSHPTPPSGAGNGQPPKRTSPHMVENLLAKKPSPPPTSEPQQTSTSEPVVIKIETITVPAPLPPNSSSSSTQPASPTNSAVSSSTGVVVKSAASSSNSSKPKSLDQIVTKIASQKQELLAPKAPESDQAVSSSSSPTQSKTSPVGGGSSPSYCLVSPPLTPKQTDQESAGEHGKKEVTGALDLSCVRKSHVLDLCKAKAAV